MSPLEPIAAAMPVQAGNTDCKLVNHYTCNFNEHLDGPTLCQGGHEVQLCIYEEDLYHCSLCGVEIRRGTRFYSCRLCDFDVCELCSRGRKVASTYRLGKKLGQGSFGEVFVANDLRTGLDYAAKLERISSKELTLAHEAKVLQLLQGGFGFAKLMHFGKECNYNVMVMDLLGPSLEDLKEKFRTFSLVTVLMLAIQMIDRIEYLHKKNVLHRDIKPDNFALGLDEAADVLHLIDFGLAKRYCDEQTSEHIPFRRRKRGLLGTPRYASINAHHGRELSRRDDLEAVTYVLVYLFKGKLPWQGLHCGGKDDRDLKIGEMKRTIAPPTLCGGMPSAFLALLNYSRDCSFKQQPDYRYLRGLFSDALVVEKDQGHPAVFDWAGRDARAGAKSTSHFHQNPGRDQQALPGLKEQQRQQEPIQPNQQQPAPNSNQQQQDYHFQQLHQQLQLQERHQSQDERGQHEGEVADDNELREFHLAGTVFERSTPAVVPGDFLPAMTGPAANRPSSLVSARTAPGQVASLPKPGDRVRLKRPSRTRSGLLREGDVGVVIDSKRAGGLSIKVKRGLAYDFYDADDIVLCQDSSCMGEPAPEPTPRGSDAMPPAPAPAAATSLAITQAGHTAAATAALFEPDAYPAGPSTLRLPPRSVWQTTTKLGGIVSVPAMSTASRQPSMSSALLADSPAYYKRRCVICKKQFRHSRDVIQCRSCNFCICKACSRRAECICYQSLDQTRAVAQTKMLDLRGALPNRTTNRELSIAIAG